MGYNVPIQDLMFNFQELGLLEKMAQFDSLAAYDEDTVKSILEENSRLVEEQIAPLNQPHNSATWIDGAVQTAPGFANAFKQFVEGGWQGLQHEEKYGGAGAPKVLHAALSESLNAACISFALCPLLTDGFIEALLAVGSEEQKEKLIPLLISGKCTGTMNLTEPQSGSDLALITSKAQPLGDGSYKVEGQKIFITYGEHDMADNIIHLVLARTPNAPAGIKGLSLFAVPKYLINDDGSNGLRNDVYCASIEHKLGIHASPTAVLIFGDNRGEVGQGAIGYLVGQENAGLQAMFIMMNSARFNVGLQGVGISERASQLAWSYAKERVQGNPNGGEATTIDHHPDVQRMLLTMQSLTEGARSLALFAASLADEGLHATGAQQQQGQVAYEYLVPIVKGFSTEMSLEVTSLGVQVHGGMGFIEETGAAQYYRDARILPIYEGTTAIQANDLVWRKTIRDDGQVVNAFIEKMRDTINLLNQQPSLAQMGHQLNQAVVQYQTAVSALLQFNQDKHRAAISIASVPYLQLAGYVHVAWHFARAVLACHGKNTQFHKRKVALAKFYFDALLSRTQSLCDTVRNGDSIAKSAYIYSLAD